MSKPATNPEDSAGGAPPAAKGGSMLGKIMVLGVVLVVVIVECAVAYLCIPAPSEATAATSGHSKPPAAHKKGEKGEKGAEPADEGDHESSGNVEIDLLEHMVTVFQPATNSNLRIEFHLFGSVASSDEKEFKRLLDENKARFKEQVQMIVRGSEMSDLTDASLGLIKRTILDKSRQIFRKPLLKDIIISDYSFLEQ